MDRATILIIDSDSPSVNDHCAHWLAQAGHTITRITASDRLHQDLVKTACDIVITEDPLQYVQEVAVMTFLKRVGINCPVILIGRTGSMGRVVEAVRSGASDYLIRPIDESMLCDSVTKALNLSVKSPKTEAKIKGPRTIVTCSTRMQQLLDTALRVAPADATVLIQGESGTGKELLAQYIHRHSARSSLTLVAMNCAALPENLAESELFGYEKGAFTGAFQRKVGKFELAHNSTLLLDEISEMQLPLQAKLLRVLQERQVDRLGGNQPIPIDVRIIATTNRDLGQMVKDGQFREDLYYRLRVIPLTIPPLRDRPEDIALLINHFMELHTSDKSHPQAYFERSAMAMMLGWRWGGNIRELENTVQRALLIRRGTTIQPEDLLLEAIPSSEKSLEKTELAGMTVKDMEKRLIEQTLVHVNQNRTYAAKMLGISIRTLRNKLNEFQCGDPAT